MSKKITVTPSLLSEFKLRPDCECIAPTYFHDISPDGRVAFYSWGPKIVVFDLYHGTQRLYVCRAKLHSRHIYGIISFSSTEGIALIGRRSRWILTRFVLDGDFATFGDALANGIASDPETTLLFRLDSENFGILPLMDDQSATLQIFSFRTMKRNKIINFPLGVDGPQRNIHAVTLRDNYMRYVEGSTPCCLNLRNGKVTPARPNREERRAGNNRYDNNDMWILEARPTSNTYCGAGHFLSFGPEQYLAIYSQTGYRVCKLDVRIPPDCVAVFHHRGVTLLNDKVAYRVCFPQTLADAAFMAAKNGRVDLNALPPFSKFRSLFPDRPDPLRCSSERPESLQSTRDDIHTQILRGKLHEFGNDVEKTVRFFVDGCPRPRCCWCLTVGMLLRVMPLPAVDAEIRRRCLCIRYREPESYLAGLNFQPMAAEDEKSGEDG